MNKVTTAARSLCIICIGFLLLPTGALAQVKKLDCAPPRGVSSADEVAPLIADAKEDCTRGTEILKEAKQWRSTAKDLRSQANRFRKDSGKLRKEANKLRDIAGDLGEETEKLQLESARIVDDREAVDSEITVREQVAGAFQGGNDSTITIPLQGSGQWEEEESRYARAKVRYFDARMNAIDDELMALEGMIQVNEELAADKEAAAVDLDQLALNNERAALEADAAASLAEEAALLGERLAIMHNLQACTQFIALNLNEQDSRRNVGRAVNYIEKHDIILSGLDAEEADRVISEAKIRFDL